MSQDDPKPKAFIHNPQRIPDDGLPAEPEKAPDELPEGSILISMNGRSTSDGVPSELRGKPTFVETKPD
jgi:hypothetical protein